VRTKLALVAILVGGLVVADQAVGSRPTASSAPANPTCSFSADLVLDPGVSSAPSSGTFATAPGKDGTYKCRGPFGYGKGPSGSAGMSGRYGTTDEDTCGKGGEGDGKLRLGDREGGPFTFTYSKFTDGVATGEFHGDRFEGTFTLTAKDGDCLLSPVRKVRLDGEGRATR
jgi:hypothetical protein